MSYRSLEPGSAPPTRTWAILLLVLGACGGTRTVERFCETDCRENWEAECATVCGLEEPETMTSTGGAQKSPADSGQDAVDAGKRPPKVAVDAGPTSEDSSKPDATKEPPMCPAECPAALCDATSGACAPCEDDEDCEGPRGACDEGQCVACADSEDCKDKDEPVCEPMGHTCVGCYEHSDCTDPGKSHCQESTCVPCQSDRDCHDPNLPQCSEGTCVGCTTDAQCGHFPLGQRACDLDSGACVQCTSTTPDACRGRVCDVLNNICTQIDPKSAEQCEACVATAQCEDGLQCVMESFLDTGEEQELGYKCLPDSTVTSCNDLYNFRAFTTARNIEGTEVSTCRPGSTTCKGVEGFGDRCNETGTPDDNACGEPGIRDAFCIEDQRAETETYRCTIPCVINEDCPRLQTCVRMGPGAWICTL